MSDRRRQIAEQNLQREGAMSERKVSKAQMEVLRRMADEKRMTSCGGQYWLAGIRINAHTVRGLWARRLVASPVMSGEPYWTLTPAGQALVEAARGRK